jgi:hypothetical protein
VSDRIVTLIASATEIVAGLGLADRLVGISHECDYPPEVLHLPRLSEPKVDASASSAEIDRSPPASILLKKAAGITAGSKTPNKEKVGKVTRKQVLDIVKLKKNDMNATSDEAAFRVVSGTARSMGIEVIG